MEKVVICIVYMYFKKTADKPKLLHVYNFSKCDLIKSVVTINYNIFTIRNEFFILKKQ